MLGRQGIRPGLFLSRWAAPLGQIPARCQASRQFARAYALGKPQWGLSESSGLGSGTPGDSRTLPSQPSKQ